MILIIFIHIHNCFDGDDDCSRCDDVGCGAMVIMIMMMVIFVILMMKMIVLEMMVLKAPKWGGSIWAIKMNPAEKLT